MAPAEVRLVVSAHVPPPTLAGAPATVATVADARAHGVVGEVVVDMSLE
jgi:hypothetical protein